jgi:hypothetical protein
LEADQATPRLDPHFGHLPPSKKMGIDDKLHNYKHLRPI